MIEELCKHTSHILMQWLNPVHMPALLHGCAMVAGIRLPSFEADRSSVTQWRDERMKKNKSACVIGVLKCICECSCEDEYLLSVPKDSSYERFAGCLKMLFPTYSRSHATANK